MQAHNTVLALLAATVLGALPAGADPRRRHAPRHAAAAAPPSASLGFANGGALVHGRLLAEDETLRFVPRRTLHYGTEELVALLERVARIVHRRFHARLSVGDLSARHGGPVGQHRSHQSGRDADIGFFARDLTGTSVDLQDYVSFNAAGLSGDGRLRFDTARNWAIVEALLTDPRAHTERVFVSAPLRARLLDYARGHNADPRLVARAEQTLLQPRRVSPHDNHFHVRIACPHDDLACREGIRLRRTARRGARPHRRPRRP